MLIRLQNHVLVNDPSACVCTGEVRFVHGVCVNHLSNQLYSIIQKLSRSDVGSGFGAGLFEQGQQITGSHRTV